MQIINTFEKNKEPIVLAMGFFDCVHMGHREILAHADKIAKKLCAKTAVTTFINNPSEVLNNDSKLIYTFDERKEIFNRLGIDFCVPFVFDEDFCSTTEMDFLNGIFNRLNIKGIVCGHDYRFGKGGNGTVDILARECKLRGIEFLKLEPIMLYSERVSTTAIKAYLRGGEIARANKMLCEPFFIQAEVIKGRGVGHTLSYPTINFSIQNGKVIPKLGVYETATIIDGHKKRSLTNIGAKPTFEDLSVSIETFIKNESRDIYGKTVRIELLKFIREIIKFNSQHELQEQITRDLATIN